MRVELKKNNALRKLARLLSQHPAEDIEYITVSHKEYAELRNHPAAVYVGATDSAAERLTFGGVMVVPE